MTRWPVEPLTFSKKNPSRANGRSTHIHPPSLAKIRQRDLRVHREQTNKRCLNYSMMLAAELSTLQQCTSCQLRLKENSRKETLWSRDLLRDSTKWIPDQSQEQLNRIGKHGGGIVGITKMPTALGRWALSYNLRSHIAAENERAVSSWICWWHQLQWRISQQAKEGHCTQRRTLQQSSEVCCILTKYQWSTTTKHCHKDLATHQIDSSLV